MAAKKAGNAYPNRKSIVNAGFLSRYAKQKPRTKRKEKNKNTKPTKEFQATSKKTYEEGEI
ncbi:hypothetical protein ACTXT7_015803 [Hymenolepis weldensis]